MDHKITENTPNLYQNMENDEFIKYVRIGFNDDEVMMNALDRMESLMDNLRLIVDAVNKLMTDAIDTIKELEEAERIEILDYADTSVVN